MTETVTVVQEQEKQRGTDKKKEEVEKKSSERRKEEAVEVQKLHVKLKQEQQRWDRECVVREKQQVSLTLMLCDRSFLSLLSFVRTELHSMKQRKGKFPPRPLVVGISILRPWAQRGNVKLAPYNLAHQECPE